MSCNNSSFEATITNLLVPQMMMHVWEHNFLLFRGFLRVKWRRMEAECGGPPPEDHSDTVLVRQPTHASAC